MKKYVFSVSGMSCAMCKSHINGVVLRTCDVDSVKSCRKRNKTVVIANALDTEESIYRCDILTEYFMSLDFGKEASYENARLVGNQITDELFEVIRSKTTNENTLDIL